MLLLTTIFAGCQSDKAVFAAQQRQLPSADRLFLMMLAEPCAGSADIAATRQCFARLLSTPNDPVIPTEIDLLLIARAYRDWGRENTYRSIVNQCAYRDVAMTLATAGAQTKTDDATCKRIRGGG